MRKYLFVIVVLVGCSACIKNNFVQQIQGTWKVVEINYIYDDDTVYFNPNYQQFVFDDNNYEFLQEGILKESGVFMINQKVTQIQFESNEGGNYSYLILERNEHYQHWKSKKKILGFYLDFKLEKKF